MNFSLKLVDSPAEISKKIAKSLSKEINRVIKKSLSGIRSDFKTLIITYLKKQPEYSSLISGTLKYDFGIADSINVDKVVDFIAETSTVEIKTIRYGSGNISGGFFIGFMKSDDMNGLIYTDIASVVDDGMVLPWLEWLLYNGTSAIIKEYQVEYGPNKNSRTGNAIMIKSDSSWSVPANFAGKQNNNWTTRAAQSINDSEILNIIQKNIERQI